MAIRLRGVAFLLDDKTGQSVVRIGYINDRILVVHLKGNPVEVRIVVVYMPTTGYSDEDVGEIYEQTESCLDNCKGKEYTILMGDWNDVVGEGREGSTVGPFGLGRRNARGDTLVDCCTRNNLCIMNT